MSPSATKEEIGTHIRRVDVLASTLVGQLEPGTYAHMIALMIIDHASDMQELLDDQRNIN